MNPIDEETKNLIDDDTNNADTDEQRDEFTICERNSLLTLPDWLTGGSQCYLRIFDGLKNNYLKEKRQMQLWGKFIPASYFVKILKSGNLQATFGTMNGSRFKNKKLVKVQEMLPDGNYHSTVHEITTTDHGIGHMESTYLHYTRGPDKFLPKDRLNINYLGYPSPNPSPYPTPAQSTSPDIPSSTSHLPFWAFLLIVVVVSAVGASFVGLLRSHFRGEWCFTIDFLWKLFVVVKASMYSFFIKDLWLVYFWWIGYDYIAALYTAAGISVCLVSWEVCKELHQFQEFNVAVNSRKVTPGYSYTKLLNDSVVNQMYSRNRDILKVPRYPLADDLVLFFMGMTSITFYESNSDPPQYFISAIKDADAVYFRVNMNGNILEVGDKFEDSTEILGLREMSRNADYHKYLVG